MSRITAELRPRYRSSVRRMAPSPPDIGTKRRKPPLDTSLVFHEVRAVVKNITMTIEDALLEEVRVAAAREGISMSRYLAKTVERALEHDHRYAAARKRFLSRQPVALRKKGRKLPTRDALHERENLR